MANESVNLITIYDDRIQFKGFPLIPETGQISVFHTENSFTIYPIPKMGIFYTLFHIENKAIYRGLNIREYVLFRAMLEEIREDNNYQFVEINNVYILLSE